MSFENGDCGCKIDYKAAEMWYRRAAEQGYPGGQSNLGTLYWNGRVAHLPGEGVRFWRLAAAQSEKDALLMLGGSYASGIGAPQDFWEALRCFKRAAALGYAGAAEGITMVEMLLTGRL